MTSSRIDDVALLQAANPVPDPEAAVDPVMRSETLERVLATPLSAPRRRRARLVRTVGVRLMAMRRVALVAGITMAAIGGLLVAGEQRSAPQRLAVLPALADDLSGHGRILHVLERTVQLAPDGTVRGDVHEEESWTLLDDATVSRFRIGTGQDAEQTAINRSGSSDYDPESNTVTIVRQPNPGMSAVEPPVVQMARDAANGKLPVSARPVINGTPTLKIEVDDGAWYIAQDAPELVRRELRRPDGGIQRTDFVTFEVLDATPANRKLLQIQAPRNARTVTVTPPSNRPPAIIPRPPGP